MQVVFYVYVQVTDAFTYILYCPICDPLLGHVDYTVQYMILCSCMYCFPTHSKLEKNNLYKRGIRGVVIISPHPPQQKRIVAIRQATGDNLPASVFFSVRAGVVRHGGPQTFQ